MAEKIDLILNQLHEEGTQAFYIANYSTALEKWQAGLKLAYESDNKRYIILFLGNIATMYLTLKKYQNALEYYQQALTLSRKIGYQHKEGFALTGIGMVYTFLKQYQQALDYSKQALKIYRKINDKPGIGKNLANLGNIYQNIGKYQQALNYYQSALELYLDIGNKLEVGNNLTNLGNIYQDIGNYQKALEYHQQVLNISFDINDKHGVAKSLTNLGNAYQRLGKLQNALEYYHQALEISHEIANKRGIGNNLNNLGAVYLSLGKYQQALEYSQQALEIKSELNDQIGVGNNLSLLGTGYRFLGDYQRALESYQQALTIAQKMGNKHGEASLLSNLGVVYRNLGKYQQALEYYQQALEIIRSFSDRHGEGNILSNLGVVYDSQGDYQKSLKYLFQALEILNKIDHKTGIMGNLGNLCNVYRHLGDYQKALKYCQQSLALSKEINDKSGIVTNLINLGSVYQKLDKYQKALEHYQQALAISREVGETRTEGGILSNLCMVYRSLGKYQKSLSSCQQALVIFQQIDNKAGIGQTLVNLGLIHHNLEKYQEAKIVFQNSITLLEELNEGEVWIAQTGLATAELQLNQPESAITHYEQAINHIEKLRVALTEKEHKLSFIQDKLTVYDLLITVLQDFHKKHPHKGYNHKTFETFERKQARVFLEQMGQSGARLFAGLAQQKSQQEFSIENQLIQINQDLVDERSKPVAGLEGEVIQCQERINNLEQRRQKLQTELEVLQKDIKTNHPDYYALKYPKPVQLDTLQKEVLQPDELMLVYGVMEDSTTLWLISKDTFLLFDLSLTEDMLIEKVKLIRRGVESQLNTQPKISSEKRGLKRLFQNALYQKTLSDLTYELYSQLVPDLVRPLLKKASTLYIVPTSSLYALPFEMLVTKPVEKPTDIPSYLIEEAPIAYLSSASLLKTLRDAKKRRQQAAPYPLLAFANPVYDDKPTLAVKNTARRITTMRSEAYRAIRGDYFAPLPETEDEAKEIAKLLNAPKDTDPLQLGEAASCATITQFKKQERLDKYQYILFATHGILPGDVDYITQPALVLSHPDIENTSDPEDNEECNGGYLTMANVFGLKLNAKLVSLSACNTGSGEQERGEGVMGLTRAFMYAGTPAIAVTLWSVESFSAKTLNVGFFQHLKEIDKPAAALRAIKLQMLRGNKGNKYKHPYYWAPFVVFGEEPLTEKPQK